MTAAHRTSDDDNGDDDGGGGDDDEQHSLIRELIGGYKELGPRQPSASTQEGDLHPFVRVPVGVM